VNGGKKVSALQKNSHFKSTTLWRDVTRRREARNEMWRNRITSVAHRSEVHRDESLYKGRDDKERDEERAVLGGDA
jgi:hypothetical protein